MQLEVIENKWIPLPDDRRLASRIWMPAGPGPFPAILEYLPYRKRDGTAPRDETTHPVFAQAGYVCVRVDIAGTGDSDGVFDDEYSEQELSDGEDVLAWIARQEWCDGNIGMIGISWGGFNGLQLAYRQPEALKAVVSVASTADRYADDIHFMGGCLLSDNFNWAAQMFAYQTRPLDPTLRPDWKEEWLERMENLPFMAADWMEHLTRDGFWKHGSVCEDFSRIEAPVLAITGWADSYVNTPPLLVENLETPAKALIGPWEHRYAHISLLGASDFHSEVTYWFDRWLKDEQNGAENLPDYRTFIQEHYDPKPYNTPRRGRWIAEAEWPSPNITHEVLHLGNDNCLQADETTGKICVATPAHVGQASGVYCAGMRIDNELPDDQSVDDALSVCFDTKPLSEPLEIMGRAILNLTFTVSEPVAQIMVRLCDVSPSGVSQRISYRAFNLTHYKSHETPEALVPGEKYQVEIHLNECAHHLRTGHLLRLALSNSYWPIVWPAPKPFELTLDLENCQLSLPVRTVTDEIDPEAPGKPQEFPTLQAEELREPSSHTDKIIEDDGTVVQLIHDDYGATRDPYHHLETGSWVKASSSIHPDNPATAHFETQWCYTFERDDWCIEVLTENTMTCDEDNFYLHRKLHAYEGKEHKEVLVKEWTKTIPRGIL